MSKWKCILCSQRRNLGFLPSVLEFAVIPFLWVGCLPDGEETVNETRGLLALATRTFARNEAPYQ